MKYGYSGAFAKRDAYKVIDAVFVPKKRYVCGRELERFPRSFVIFTLLAGVVSIWSWVTHLQLTGHFMCKSVFVQVSLLDYRYKFVSFLTSFPNLSPSFFLRQFSDEVRPELSYFFGFYEMKIGKDKRANKVSYWEERSKWVNNGKPSIFRFCGNNNDWVLTFANDDDVDSECDNPFASTGEVTENALFDFMVASENSWTANDPTWSRSLPISRVFITCSSKEFNPASLEKFPDPCYTLTLDERYGGFQGTREWPTTFQILMNGPDPSLVYERAVFVGDTKDGITDLIFYMGYRWALTSTALLQDLKDKTVGGLTTYLEAEFHAYTSNYTIAFFSGPVEIDTTSDLPNPISSSWSMATTKLKDSFQAASSTGSDVEFICKTCSERNSCFSQGVCKAGVCDCVNGGSGTLCQISPQSDGHCDMYYNTPEFNYDGGDCCSNTCISTNTFECGKDRTKEVELGYDVCISRGATVCEGCWKQNGKEVFGDTNAALSGSAVSLSSSGRVLAVGDTGINTVRVLDKRGAEWKLRGSLITGPEDSEFGSSVYISGPTNATQNPRQLIPVTVLALGKNYARIYDWIAETRKWIDISPSNINIGVPGTVSKARLQDSGNIFGILSTTFLRLWTRDYFGPLGQNTWISQQISGSFEDFALTQDGKYVFAVVKNDKEVIRFNRQTLAEEEKIKLTEECLAIQTSSDGSLFAALVKYRDAAEIWVFKKEANGSFGTSYYKGKSIRGVPLQSQTSPSLGVTDDGLTVTVSYQDDGTIRTFSWKDPIWVETLQKLVGSSLSMLPDGTALAVGERGNDESGPDRGKITYYTRNEIMCASDEQKLRFTFSFDDYPTETLWQFQTSEDSSHFFKDGPYKYNEISVTQVICVPSNKCMSLIVFDTRGNGIQSPGLISISGNGHVLNQTIGDFGFEKRIPIPGIASCNSVDRPWVEVELHERCRDVSCEWTEIGQPIYGKNADENSGNAVSLSQDGKIIAIGSKSSKSANGNIVETGMVSIYEFNESKKSWNLIGERLYGEKEKDTFGHAVNLSSNGKRLVVGVPSHDGSNDETDMGLIQVFEYKTSSWVKLGNDITGDAASNRFGESVSISGDGSVICAGATGNSNGGSSSGHVRAFHYKDAENKWIQRGQDINGEEVRDYFGISVALSRDGSIMAAGADFNDGKDIQAGHVRVYEYSSALNKWNQLGEDIDGESEDDLSGSSISISWDGKTVAIGAILNEGGGAKAGHVRVYSYDGIGWIQKGQDIDGEAAGDNSGGAVSLSDNGSILAIGARFNSDSAVNAGHIRVYQFVPRTQMWHQIGSDIDGEFAQDLFGSSVSISSDGLRVAAGSPSYDDSRGQNIGLVKVYEFDIIAKNINSDQAKLSCSEDSSRFHLQIIPDTFPKDLSWGLFDRNGNRLRFEDFSVSNEVISKGQNITRQLCLKKSEIVSFFITDRYGDGLCCSWGEGSFEIYYDDKKISDSSEFTSVRSLCITDNPSDFSPFALDITLDDHPEQTWWLLYDSTSGTDLIRSVGSYNQPYGSVRQSICVLKSKCFTFVIGDASVENKGFDGLKGNGGYLVSYDAKVVQPKTSDFGATDFVRVGSQCSPPNGQVLVQVVTHSAFTAEGAHWIVTPNDNFQVLMQGSNYTKSFHGEYAEVFVAEDICLNFRMFDSADLSYSIYWNGTLAKHGHRESGKVNVVRFGPCSQCQGETDLFQVVILEEVVDNQRDAPWYLADQNGTQVLEGGRYREKRHTHYHEYCAPKNECMKFNIFGQVGTTYQIMWAGVVLDFAEPIKSVDVRFGTCTNCPGQSLLSVFLNMGEKVNRLGWSVVESEQGTFISRQTAGTYKPSDQFQQYVSTYCVSSEKCYNVTFTDTCSGSCLKYEVLWDYVMVSNGTTFDQSPQFQVGKCS